MNANLSLNKEALLANELGFYLQKDLHEQTAKVGQTDGFLIPELRIRAYRLLLGPETENLAAKHSEQLASKMTARTTKIMVSDINRSVQANSLFANQPSDLREDVKRRTEHLLQNFFAKNPQYCYYQGFNSVAEATVLIFDKDSSFDVLDGIADKLLSAFLNPDTFESSVNIFNEKVSRVIYKTTGIILKA